MRKITSTRYAPRIPTTNPLIALFLIIGHTGSTGDDGKCMGICYLSKWADPTTAYKEILFKNEYTTQTVNDVITDVSVENNELVFTLGSIYYSTPYYIYMR